MPDTWADPSLYADQVHPNDAGHALIANEIAEYIATA
jgi:lysophospholipase L1-like esterase